MLFNSFEFFIFFPVVTALYFALPHRLRWGLLLLASAVFYMAFIPAYILVLLGIILIDYCAAIWMENAADKRRKTAFFLLSIAANVGILAFFKYYNFTAENLSAIARFIGWNYSLPALSFVLPIGLSFHTFQAMSYTIEVFRGRQRAERHLGIYALYVLFYPQLVAGPIERPQHLLHQFREEHRFVYDRVARGLRRMAWGLFKKVVIADRAAAFVDRVYDHPAEYQGISIAIATAMFAFQIFCDFSGYSDIAIGSAEVMGFRLMNNFDRPYRAASIGDFWRRWHISLSSWFREYVYIPLGGNRVSRFRHALNVMIVFLLSGVWHGAAWTFVAWGVLHGAYLVCSAWSARARESLSRAIGLYRVPRLRRGIGVAWTFSLVSFAWIFFRAESLPAAWHMIQRLFMGWGENVELDHAIFLDQGASKFFVTAAAILFMEAVHSAGRKTPVSARFERLSPAFRFASYAAFFWLIVFFGKFGERQFIYFVF